MIHEHLRMHIKTILPIMISLACAGSELPVEGTLADCLDPSNIHGPVHVSLSMMGIPVWSAEYSNLHTSSAHDVVDYFESMLHFSKGQQYHSAWFKYTISVHHLMTNGESCTEQSYVNKDIFDRSNTDFAVDPFDVNVNGVWYESPSNPYYVAYPGLQRVGIAGIREVDDDSSDLKCVVP